MVLLSRQEYKANTKKFQLEEPFDYWIYRPLAYFIVKLTYSTSITPNQFSLFALLFALLGAFYIQKGEKWSFFVGGVCIFIFSVLDCCDGMVARMKKNGSKYGALIDMLVDAVSNLAIYLALFIGLKKQNYTYPIEYLTLLCGVCILIHASIYNFYKKQFQFYLEQNPEGRKRELLQIQRDLERLKKEDGSKFERILLTLYLFFSSTQKDEDQNKAYPVQSYLSLNEPVLPMWAFIAGSSHLTFLSAALILNEMPIYLYFALVISNLWLLFVWMIQRSIYKNLDQLI